MLIRIDYVNFRIHEVKKTLKRHVHTCTKGKIIPQHPILYMPVRGSYKLSARVRRCGLTGATQEDIVTVTALRVFIAFSQ
jgi:hypothetical protein